MAGIFAGQMGNQKVPGGMGQPGMQQNLMDPQGGSMSMNGGGFQSSMAPPQQPPPGMDPAQFQRQMAKQELQTQRHQQNLAQQQMPQQGQISDAMWRAPQMPQQMQPLQQMPGAFGSAGGLGQPPQQQGGFDQEAWLQQNSPGFRPPEMGPPPGQQPQQMGQISDLMWRAPQPPQGGGMTTGLGQQKMDGGGQGVTGLAAAFQQAQQPRPMPQRPPGAMGGGGFKPQQPVLHARPSNPIQQNPMQVGQMTPTAQPQVGSAAASSKWNSKNKKPPGY